MSEPTDQASRVDLNNYAIHHQQDHDTVVLKPHQAFSVPAGMLHRPVVPMRSTVIMIEKAGIVATGD